MNNDLTVTQHREETNANVVMAMDTEITHAPMSALEKLKAELANKRNLDVGFETKDFDLKAAIDMILELDKYTASSVLMSLKFFSGANCIRQALRILPNYDIPKTSEGRDEYDHLVTKTMDEYEKEGDYQPSLPAFVALDDYLRSVMHDAMMDERPLQGALEFMTKDKPTASNFERDYDDRVRLGLRPGISKREFCEMQLEDAIKQHQLLIERGQSAIQFCEDLQIGQDRGFGDLPDWAVDSMFNKVIDKLMHRWGKLDIRRTNSRLKPADQTEAQADQTLIEFVYEELTGRKVVTEY